MFEWYIEIFYKTPKNTIIGRYYLIELRPSIRSLDIESLGSLDQDRDQKCLKKMLVGNRRFSSFMLGKCLVLLENLFKTYAWDRSVIARNFLMLDHFSAGDRSDGYLIQNQKLCSRSLRLKTSMLEMLEIDIFATRSQLYHLRIFIAYWPSDDEVRADD